jgi:hypothetical protein
MLRGPIKLSCQLCFASGIEEQELITTTDKA